MVWIRRQGYDGNIIGMTQLKISWINMGWQIAPYDDFLATSKILNQSSNDVASNKALF